MAEQNLLEVKGLKKVFGDVIALKDARFTLKKGSIHALCGGNGAGKSTFLSLLMGFIQPDEGEILIKAFLSPETSDRRGHCDCATRIKCDPRSFRRGKYLFRQ